MLLAVGVRISTPFRPALIPDLVVVKAGGHVPALEPADVLLAVAVWSAGKSNGEREIEMAAYAEAGVAHLWLVETPPGKPVVFRGYRREDAKYVEVVYAGGGETITAPGPVPVKINIAELP